MVHCNHFLVEQLLSCPQALKRQCNKLIELGITGISDILVLNGKCIEMRKLVAFLFWTAIELTTGIKGTVC